MVLGSLGVPAASFAPVCVLVDKLEKVPLESLAEDFDALGVGTDVVKQLVEVEGGSRGG